ncbi:MAG: transglutaminase domain-containing protein [Phycisphaerales bacterium]|nr:transglutaminase domain-containing protein [Phycisphaerales bacterium]
MHVCSPPTCSTPGSVSAVGFPTLRGGMFLMAALAAALSGCAPGWRSDVELALRKAGPNRPELERVLRLYRQGDDPQKYEAACFLIANMEGHGFVDYALYDASKNEIPFDALAYADFPAAQTAIDEIEKKHGAVDFARKSFVSDLETISAALLIDNIEQAFSVWREKPWAKDVSWEAFREHILPYRGSNEPLCSTRGSILRDCESVVAGASPLPTASLGAALRKNVDVWIQFNELYYVHPTDQSYEEMRRSKRGRCEDITNMILYVMRAHGIPYAADYTPWWADRDNNHAWEVVLDSKGRGAAPMSNRAAKVFRKTFSAQRNTLAFTKGADEQAPRWLDGRTFFDVTDQYLRTSDVTVKFDAPKPPASRYAYLCVFNGGEWRPIYWGRIGNKQATFERMGRDIAYLPAYFADSKLIPAAAPLILEKSGSVRVLLGDSPRLREIHVVASKESTISPPGAPLVVNVPAPGECELFMWKGEWKSLGKAKADSRSTPIGQAPDDALLWLTSSDGRKLERIFTLGAEGPVWW